MIGAGAGAAEGEGVAAAAAAAAAEANRKPLPWQQRAWIAVQVASALAHLHSRDPPMIHRDVKSANVLLDGEGNAKVHSFYF